MSIAAHRLRTLAHDRRVLAAAGMSPGMLAMVDDALRDIASRLIGAGCAA